MRNPIIRYIYIILITSLVFISIALCIYAIEKNKELRQDMEIEIMQLRAANEYAQWRLDELEDINEISNAKNERN